jgi:hypothetical protein
MNECHQIEPGLQLKINDMLAKSVRLRSRPGARGDREVVVEDPWLGVFALHRQFDLLVKQKDSEWRAVTLDELRSILVSTKDVLDAGEEASDHQTLAPTLPDESTESREKPPGLVRLGEIIGLDACVQRIEAILYRASIPHLTAGSTFVVPSMLNARECLRQAGFHQDQRYESVLVDPESGITVRLLERAPRSFR